MGLIRFSGETGARDTGFGVEEEIPAAPLASEEFWEYSVEVMDIIMVEITMRIRKITPNTSL
jgi:hypothetical protein